MIGEIENANRIAEERLFSKNLSALDGPKLSCL